MSGAPTPSNSRPPRQAADDAVRVVADDGAVYQLRTRIGSAPGPAPVGLLEFDEVLLPVLLWRAVPVVLLRHERISALERFSLEAAGALRGVGADELAALTGLPDRALLPLLRRLVDAGALKRTRDTYLPTPVTGQVLDGETVPAREESTLDFGYFPDTDELVVLSDTAATPLDKLMDRRMSPALHMAVDEKYWDLPRHALINRHLSDRLPGRYPEELLEARERDETVETLCPVYRAEPAVFRTGGRGGRATVTLRSGARRAGPGGDRRRTANSFAVEAVFLGLDQLGLRLAGLMRCAAQPDLLPVIWRTVTTVGGAGPGPILPDGLSLDAQDPGRPVLRLPRAATAAMAARRSLTEPVGVQVLAEKAVFRIAVQFRPCTGDDEAAVLFAVDLAATRLATDPSLGFRTAISRAAEEFGLSPDPGHHPDWRLVQERMWQLKMYEAVYLLRGNDDFSYT